MSDFDVIVIGSGFGGMTVAARLAATDRSVCLFERGTNRSTFPIERDQFFDEGVWNPRRRKFGIVEYLSFDPQRLGGLGIDIIQGAGLGGGSLHYYGVTKEPPDAAFSQNRSNGSPMWPTAITNNPDGRVHNLGPFYEMARDVLNPDTIRTTPGMMSLPPKPLAFADVIQDAGDGAGSEFTLSGAEYVPLNINFGQRADDQRCNGIGHCLLGCNPVDDDVADQRSPKNTLKFTYLPIFNKGKKSEYKLRHEAKQVFRQGGHFRVAFENSRRRTVSYTADMVVISAGTIGSTKLMLRSLASLGNPTLPMLGKRFAANGESLYSGTLTDGNPVCMPFEGPSITSGADFEIQSAIGHIQDVGVSPVMDIVLRATLWANEWGTHRLPYRLLRRFMQGLGNGWLGDLDPIPPDIGDVRNFLPYLVMGLDQGEGTIKWDSAAGRLDVTPPSDPNGYYSKIDQLMNRISGINGFSYIRNLWQLNRRRFTAHPLGGCVMSDDSNAGVVDAYGQVHGVPGLYIADGSIVPGSIGMNPSLTITALAEWIADRIINPP